MCNSPFSAFYIFWAIGFVLFFVIMHLLKNNKSGSEGKSKSEHSSSTIDKLSKIKSLKESNSSTESAESKNITNSEETEPKIIIAPREERITKEQITESIKEKTQNKNINKPVVNESRSETDNTTNAHIIKEKNKLDSYSIAFIFGAVGRIATLISFIFVYINGVNFETKFFVFSIIGFLIPVIGGICSIGYWSYIIIGTFIKPFLPMHIFIISIICLIISIVAFSIYLYNKVYDNVPHYKQRALNAATFTLIPLVIITIVFSIVQINNSNSIISNNDLKSKKIILNSISDYVSPGDTAHISVTAKPNTEYSISVSYSSGFSEAEGLENKTSDSNGRVSWSWKVGTNTYSGEYPVTITNHKDLTEFETFYFTVK